MRAHGLGLTAFYNQLHDPAAVLPDIPPFRELQMAVDSAVAQAYGWGGLRLEHCFRETKQGVRFTISAEAWREALDRLLKLNHERHQEEVRLGLRGKGRKKSAGRRKRKKSGGNQPTFF